MVNFYNEDVDFYVDEMMKMMINTKSMMNMTLMTIIIVNILIQMIVIKKMIDNEDDYYDDNYYNFGMIFDDNTFCDYNTNYYENTDDYATDHS